ncbi:MAG TPA: hypothetical protein VLV83_02770 [Acidobacteriota bacterium]|nr:hypothetical protein [Acidobacteriota bacterium]
MSLIQVGPIYINPSSLTGVSDVQKTRAPDGGSASYSFAIYLEGSMTSVVSDDEARAKAMHDKVRNRINPGFRFSSGGVTLSTPAVNSIGAVSSEPTREDPEAAGFLVQMDGVTVNLQYVNAEKANEGRSALVEKIGLDS